MSCIRGFVCAVPGTNRAAFMAHAAEALRDRGCLRAVDCWGDDVPEGNVTALRKAVLAQDDEVVVASWYVWPTKAAHHPDAIPAR
ncbi:MAG: DUF1428 family protein [Rhodobacteraceae bacterium]|nr:DUF1428 family protein [Paracoccaceae bacterium]